jgi:6-phosphogluconolactonase
VPPSDPESNFGMAWDALLRHVPISADHVHRMEAERNDLDTAAREYAALLGRYVPRDAAGVPRFHAILLGLGGDGHTASLFPGTDLEQDPAKWVTVTVMPGRRVQRMTLTLAVLNAAERVLFQVAGSDKAVPLRWMLHGAAPLPPVPAELVTVPNGTRVVLADRAAASLFQAGVAGANADAPYQQKNADRQS